MNPMPRETLEYESPSGKRLVIGAGSSYRYGDTDLFDASWSYDVDSGDVTRLRREPRESTLTLYVDAPDEASGLEARERLEDVLDEGVPYGRPGTLRCGEWYTRCLCVARRKDNWWFDGRLLEVELSLLRPSPAWTRDDDYASSPDRAVESGWLDFPFDFPFDFSPNRAARSISVDSAAPSDWRIVVYGPASRPSVRIGDNEHRVDVDVPAGSLLIADSRDWSLILKGPDGVESDAFSRRIRGREGSGEFMWESIKPGTSAVTWDESFSWDLTVFVERG